jgi:uncharacterized protein YegJ (DUF2314 family)
MKLHVVSRLLLILLAACSFAVAGCGESMDGPEVVKREGEPDVIRSQNDQQLDRAVAKAKETYTQLVAALKDREPQHRGHAVKKPFATRSGDREHIWISDVSWDGDGFSGVINNEPVETQEVKLGDRVKVTPDELSDWMYIDGNRIVGGYTIRVLHYQQSPEDQKAFTDQTGLIVPPADF